VVGAALIALWVSLAAPVAHGQFTLECAPTYANAAGVTDAAAARVRLGPETCASLQRLTLHRRATSQDLEFGLRTLLHEARHVGQYRDGWNFLDPSQAYEHDAECTALRELPHAANTLGYRGQMVADGEWLVRYEIEHLEVAPYGGACATTRPSPSGGGAAPPGRPRRARAPRR
jgi:hypothetical protein